MIEFIYGLICPKSLKVRYVGKTYNVNYRLTEHKYHFKRLVQKGVTKMSKKEKWFKELLNENLLNKLQIVVLDEGNKEEIFNKEKEWIERMVINDLVNSNSGGGGGATGEKQIPVFEFTSDGLYVKPYDSLSQCRFINNMSLKKLHRLINERLITNNKLYSFSDKVDLSLFKKETFILRNKYDGVVLEGSLLQIANYFNVEQYKIRYCCDNKLFFKEYTICGWSDEYNLKEFSHKEIVYSDKTFCVYDIKKDSFNIFSTVTQIREFIGVNNGMKFNKHMNEKILYRNQYAIFSDIDLGKSDIKEYASSYRTHVKSPPPVLVGENNIMSKPVYSKDIITQEVKKYDSILQCCNLVKIDRSTLNSVIERKGIYLGRVFYHNVNDDIKIEKSPVIRYNIVVRSIDLSIEESAPLPEIAKLYSIPKTTLARNIQSKRMINNKYFHRDYEKFNFTEFKTT